MSTRHFLYGLSRKELNVCGTRISYFHLSWHFKSTLSVLKTVIMTFYVDEVLIMKVQDAVKEIGAEIHVANNFTCGTLRSTNDDNEKRLECSFT